MKLSPAFLSIALFAIAAAVVVHQTTQTDASNQSSLTDDDVASTSETTFFTKTVKPPLLKPFDEAFESIRTGTKDLPGIPNILRLTPDEDMGVLIVEGVHGLRLSQQRFVTSGDDPIIFIDDQIMNILFK